MLEAINISKYYADFSLFEGVSLKLDKGERLALSGVSGVGKTSLIYILAGLDDDFSGKVIRKTDHLRVLFQDLGLFSHKCVRDNILYLLPEKELYEDEYETWLQVVGLKGCEDMYPYQLSRGMKQKVAIVRSFLARPELIFLDEPFSALDKASIDKIVAHILSKYDQTAMVIASHTKLDARLCRAVFELENS